MHPCNFLIKYFAWAWILNKRNDNTKSFSDIRKNANSKTTFSCFLKKIISYVFKAFYFQFEHKVLPNVWNKRYIKLFYTRLLKYSNVLHTCHTITMFKNQQSLTFQNVKNCQKCPTTLKSGVHNCHFLGKTRFTFF